MESEERPLKIRKTSHGADSPEAEFAKDAGSSAAQAEKISQRAETSISHDQRAQDGTNEVNEDAKPEATETGEDTPKLSKNQQKKLRRKEQWEAGREDRKVKRREKIKEKKERRREEYQRDPSLLTAARAKTATKYSNQVLPVTIIFDCDFDDMMFDNEMKSLGTQITRCYSDNRNAAFKTHLAISSFGGNLKERCDGILAGQYKSWNGIRFLPDDFVTVAEKAKEWMRGPKGGQIAGALEITQSTETDTEPQTEGEVVYLSSESDVTLERLNPYSTYIIGGLVDHNRHKGICHKRAVERGIKTAKLPIGDFLQMNSRQVLATNHVLEIMLKWLEVGDWGEAFMHVMPKRKGGTLKDKLENSTEPSATGSAADEDEHVEAEEDQDEQQARELRKIEKQDKAEVEAAADDS